MHLDAEDARHRAWAILMAQPGDAPAHCSCSAQATRCRGDYASGLRVHLLKCIWLIWTSMDTLVDAEDLNDPVTLPPWGQVGRNITLGVVSLAGKFVLQVCNRMDVKHHSRLTELVINRPPGVGLITVSNHGRQAVDCTLY